MFKSILSIILTIVTFITSIFYTGLNNKPIEKEYSIISQGKIIGSLKGDLNSDENYIDIVFPDNVEFDTVVLKEKGNRITSFSVSVKDGNGEFKEVYKQERVGEYRYCILGEIVSNQVRITVNSADDNKFRLKSIDILNVTDNENKDFRVTSYIVCPGFYYDKNVDTEKLLTITDVILFGIARFNENGEIYYHNVDSTSGEDVLKSIVFKLKNANPNINIYCNLLGPDGSTTDEKEALHSKAFIDNGDIFAENIVSMLDEFGFDGIFFDYEYPYKAKSKRNYSDFIVKLDSVIGDYKIGVALAEWNCDLSAKAIDIIDRIEIMAYDDMSVYNQHSEFASNGGILAIESFEKKGYDLSKCDLGLPFYGRTHGGEEAWPSYAQIANDIDSPFTNVVNKSYLYGGIYDEGLTTSFNGVQMIKDKTAFAYDYGLGGVMVWHYSCDVPYENDLSLFKAVQTSLNTRN